MVIQGAGSFPICFFLDLAVPAPPASLSLGLATQPPALRASWSPPHPHPRAGTLPAAALQLHPRKAACGLPGGVCSGNGLLCGTCHPALGMAVMHEDHQLVFP